MRFDDGMGFVYFPSSSSPSDKEKMDSRALDFLSSFKAVVNFSCMA